MYRLIIIVTLLVSGCTSMLWAPEYEQDELTGFFVNDSDDELLVIGHKYAYKFEMSSNLSKTLGLSRELEFTPFVNNFKLSEDNTISGTLELYVHGNDVSNEQTRELLFLDFEPFSPGNFRKDFKLKGRRYKVDGLLPFVKLENKMSVTYERPRTSVETASKILITPAAVATDAVYVPVIIAAWTVAGVVIVIDGD